MRRWQVAKSAGSPRSVLTDWTDMSPVPDFSEITENARIDSIVTPKVTEPPLYWLRLANASVFRLHSLGLAAKKLLGRDEFEDIIFVDFVQHGGRAEIDSSTYKAMRLEVTKRLRKCGLRTGGAVGAIILQQPEGSDASTQYFRIFVRVYF